MILYLDTSAYLKLFFQETGSDLVDRAISDARWCATHLITYTEMRAGFARGRRMGRQSNAETEKCVRGLEEEWGRFTTLVEPDPALIRRAGQLADTHNLRGYDSVHLAAAEAVPAQVTPAPFRFAVFDDGLGEAARSLGLALVGDH